MAISGKHAVAINTIRVRGLADIEPGTVFEHESSDEANRLFSMDVLREATKDEADLYDARVKEGKIARRTLSGEGDNVFASAAGGGVPLSVTAADAVAAAKKVADEVAAPKAATPVAPKGGKKDDDL